MTEQQNAQQSELTIEDVPAARRFEARKGDDVVGRIDYELDGPRIEFPHTWTDPKHRGEGIAAQLVEAALAGAREAGLKVVPTCPYVRDYIAEHGEHQDLLAEG
ncbi:hypothetical protein SAMN05445756_1059 [Kytococcus aerolatus]|uniref:Uncharacterized protein n=1 Tax=Kytococcus aerolatus TaxID=592308 RepID=A0A212TDM9_9MICO|nr:GNAT family N-acetyltransferase [Kytococcus aerolatus]SNC64177.1 hypothetical protein SAMN05445756_1059 [Kytococcus aerolatus]